MTLTVQELANLCMYSWEIEREAAFHMSPANFRQWVSELSDAELNVLLENLGLLFRTVRNIGDTKVELKEADKTVVATNKDVFDGV